MTDNLYIYFIVLFYINMGVYLFKIMIDTKVKIC